MYTKEICLRVLYSTNIKGVRAADTARLKPSWEYKSQNAADVPWVP